MRGAVWDPIEAPYGARSEAEIAEALADREREFFGESDLEAAPGDGLEAAEPTRDELRALVSEFAVDLVVGYESGGRAYYEQVVKSAPVWPGYRSGVTIGFGYDLGFHTADDLQTDWGGWLDAAATGRLATACGFSTAEPGRDEKVRRARRLIRQLADVKIPWSVAESMFEAQLLPHEIAKTLRHLPQLRALHPHSAGALVSLVMNRGASFRSRGQRYREMRAIREALVEGAPERVPGLLRAMTRIWGEGSSLSERREREAQLFEQGLAARRREAAVASQLEGVAAPGELPPDIEDDASDWYALEQELEAAELEQLEGVGGDVYWPRNDANSPDYRHLDAAMVGKSFTLTPDALKLIIAANAFPAPQQRRVLFALRGAALQDPSADARIDVPEIRLRDQRPDHRQFRCVIGVWDRERDRLSAFIASTVPNAKAVRYFYNVYHNARQKAWAGNLLPTGSYGYIVGPHITKSKHVPGAFLLRRSLGEKTPVTVLRSVDDYAYGSQDMFHTCRPGDNIHPAFGTEKFSSFGCLTVKGTYSGGEHRGEWKLFRTAAGVDTELSEESPVRLVLVTGLEAAIAADLARDGLDASDERVREQLSRLRHGSVGQQVSALRERLGLAAGAEFDAGVKKALADLQKRRFGAADGVYTPELDAQLGWGVFGPALIG